MLDTRISILLTTVSYDDCATMELEMWIVEKGLSTRSLKHSFLCGQMGKHYRKWIHKGL